MLKFHILFYSVQSHLLETTFPLSLLSFLLHLLIPSVSPHILQSQGQITLSIVYSPPFLFLYLTPQGSELRLVRGQVLCHECALSCVQ